MKILIADKAKLFKYDLSFKEEDTFSLSYKPIDYKDTILILFEKKGNDWFLKSSGSVNVLLQGVVAQEARVANYNCYVLNILDGNITLLLYLLPDHEDFERYDTSKIQSITIGNAGTNIIYQNNNLSNSQTNIQNSNGIWILNTTSNAVYVNHTLVKQKQLKFGDLIFIHGLKIIFMGTFIEVNNPSNLVTVSGITEISRKNPDGKDNNAFSDVTEEEKNVALYREDEYFYHTPRLRQVIDSEIVKIDSPPGNQEKEMMPFWLTIGTSLVMFAGSFMMIWTVYRGLSSGEKTILDVLPQIFMVVAMLVGSLIMPRLLQSYQKKKAKQREELRQTKYSEYLQKKQNQIIAILKKQASILDDNAVSIKRCLTAIQNKDRNYWSREIEDDDFLELRLGLGDLPAKLEIQAPEEHFTLDEDNLLNNSIKVAQNNRTLNDVPITLSLTENKIVSFILNMPNKKIYIEELMLQIIALHSSTDLKMIIFTNKESESDWEFAKSLSHLWTNDKSQRFFATTLEEAKTVSNYLTDELNKRVLSDGKESEEKKESDKKEKEPYKNYHTYYLIITDDYKTIKNIPIMTEIQKYEKNYGFGLIVFEDSMKNLPAECKTFVQIDDKSGAIIDESITNDSQTKFRVETNPQFDIMQYAKMVANTPVNTAKGADSLPSSITFLDMFGVSKIEQLNISNRWKTNNPVTSLATCIGVHVDGEPFILDLHEKFHGPHGLIAGSTGSGKSEFIITYILSLALNYDPREVQFVLIDYKGGGLAGAFENKETGVKIPHLIGSITNLDANEINRSLVSIQSELKRRQRIFNEVKDKTGESTVDIYKYQKMFREGQVKEPMAHLFIISDEFAELKSQQPEFLAQLVSTARIGRSLGVHLILATQKPSGVVNDQIWSNSKFKICLKVQDRSDSMEVLKKPDAASIKEAGRFYLQVGYNDLFDIGQSGWSGARYVPSDKIVRKIDDAINFVDDVGYVTKTIKDVIKVAPAKDIGDQLTNLVKYIYELGKKQQIENHPLWLAPIEPVIYLNNLKQKYNYKPTPYVIDPLIGEYDDPNNQRQNRLNLNLTDNGNTIIYGAAGSGKENLLTTIIWSIATEHTPQEVSIYIMDFGSEMLRMFHKFPHIGDIMGINDSEKIMDAFQMINDEIEKRKALFADYGGSYEEYCKNSGQKLPLMITIINGYDMFTETFPRIIDNVANFYRDGSKYGVVFIVTAIQTNAIRSRVMQSFNHLICLQIPNESDYRSLLGCPRGLTPSKYFGRGLIKLEDNTYEFQTALFVERSQINNVVRMSAPKLMEAYKGYKVPPVPSVPDTVTVDLLLPHLNNLTNVPVGYDIDTKQITTFNFKKGPFTTILTGVMDVEKIYFIFGLLKLLTKMEGNKVHVIDFVKAYDRVVEGVTAYTDNFDQAIIEMNNTVIKEKDNLDNNIYVILGIGEYKNKINEGARTVMNQLFMNADQYTNAHFIFIDLYASYKNVQVEPWYQSKIDNSNGIWLGTDAGSQMAISITDLTMDDRKLNFKDMAFTVDGGKRKVIRHVVDPEENNE